MHKKNNSGIEVLDKIASHKATEEVYKDKDGLWVYLNDGWNCHLNNNGDWNSRHIIHKQSVEEIFTAFDEIYEVKE